MQLVVPAIRTKEVLQEMHNGGSGAHSGINNTLSKVRERFYWVRCREEVENWCKKCRTCAAVKRPKIKAKGPMQLQNVCSPFGRTVVDGKESKLRSSCHCSATMTGHMTRVVDI